MNIKALIEEITLVAEAGDAEDALDLSRQLIRQGDVKRGIDVRRSVSKGALDRDFLRRLAVTVAEEAVAHQVWMQQEFRWLVSEGRALGAPAGLMDELERLTVGI
ncbi:hypothetical protein [Actinacidiphila sp. ITFR-21]|uniref:hypothetical protein n=1 Tax=Actinacidiphila sp. ITFR-21 TaxID=3075199 RepID=UPI00288C4B77|nr:hypothetical protein [Streptomyces sp. ITFR-21]WNI20381.1 hypothetical protein RLT57_32780 [Streptomyces sp. ITFR-21]